ncbi:MAG: hypothetical protein HDKAJFGB_00803 [Anaerolineae bacterium]|nr:hypothetical protein [Anaerolineae bacterium]
MLISDQDSFIKTPFDNEGEIETVVQKYSEQLFGSNIIYLTKAKISTAGGAGIIPDGFVIDVHSDEWFIVEAERALHGTWEHIAPQISKQLAAAETQKTREIVLQLALNELQINTPLREMFKDLGIAELKIHTKLQAILRKPPTIAIPIDAIPSDLQEWARTLRTTVKIWEIEKYISANDPSRILYSLPEENLPTVETKPVGGTMLSTITATSAPSFQDLVKAGLLADGKSLSIEYKPRGGQKQTFTGIVRSDGIEVDGKVYSPSYASLYSLRKANKNIKSSNGWQTWRTEDGTLISVLRDRLQASKSDTSAEAPKVA